MSEPTLKELRDDWALKMAARYGAGHPRAGERITEVDAKYAREVFALGVQIAEREAAEAARPQINEAQLAWLNRAQGATDKEGKRLSQPNSPYALNLLAARAKVYEGGDISAVIADTEKVLGDTKGKLGPEFAELTDHQRQLAHEAGMNFGPPSGVHSLPGIQPTNTNQGGA